MSKVLDKEIAHKRAAIRRRARDLARYSTRLADAVGADDWHPNGLGEIRGQALSVYIAACRLYGLLLARDLLAHDGGAR